MECHHPALNEELQNFLVDIYGKDNFHGLCRKLSVPPPTTFRVNTLKTTADKFCESLRERVIRQAKHRQVDEKELAKLRVIVHPKIKDVIQLDTLGPFDRDTQGLPVACVDSFCGESVFRGADVYAGGIVALESSAAVNQLVQVWMDPFGAITRGSTQFDTSRLIYVGNGLLLQSRREIFHSSVCEGLAIQIVEPVYFAPSLFDIVSQGIGILQNLPCTVVGHVMDPKPGQRILDLCASPGGKTSHLATLMHNQGTLVALDRNRKKVEAIESLCKKWGIDIVYSYVVDATKFRNYIQEFSSEQDHFSVKPPFIRESFDSVLVDPPCSAFGLRPKFQYTLSMKDWKGFSRFQKIFLLAGILLLKPGGCLVYSTCTLDPLENEENIAYCLEHFPVELIEQPIYVGETSKI
ncbi:Putative methyltransferase NSUN6 [Galdieria sulphuraria]|nr:Putative methyltransferase NSUN6 [Galdieria sulphuraria]